MTADTNIITIRTHSDKPTTERRIDLREVPEQVKNRIIKIALVVAADAGMCRVCPEDNDAEASSDLEELERATRALEQYGEVMLEAAN
jgi:hypothetical protein